MAGNWQEKFDTARNGRSDHERHDREAHVRASFWDKLRASFARVPFAEDLVASYYCAMDPATPRRAKAMLLAALAYFILPADAIPDLLLGVGLTDDAAVLAIVIGLVSQHIRPEHRAAAASALKDKDEVSVGT